jgi:hypothetical protein
MQMVIITSRPLYSRGNCSRYPQYRRMGGPQRRSGHYEEETNLAPFGNQTPAAQPVAIPTELIFKLKQWEVESNLALSALRPLIGLLCKPRVIMIMDKLKK